MRIWEDLTQFEIEKIVNIFPTYSYFINRYIEEDYLPKARLDIVIIKIKDEWFLVSCSSDDQDIRQHYKCDKLEGLITFLLDFKLKTQIDESKKIEPLSAEFLKSRKVCCGSKCINCPYNWANVKS